MDLREVVVEPVAPGGESGPWSRRHPSMQTPMVTGL